MYINSVNIGINRQPVIFTFEARVTAGSGGWTTLDSESVTGLASTGYTATFTWANTTAYGEYRIHITQTKSIGEYRQIAELEFLVESYVTKDMGVTGGVSVDFNTVVLETDAAVDVGNSEYNIAYNLNGAGMTSVMTPAVFKALGVIPSITSLELQIWLVTTSKFDSIEISGVSRESLLLLSGVKHIVDDVVQSGLVNDGVLFSDTTVQITSATELDTTDFSNPPTDAELDSAFTSPSSKGAGWRRLLDDNGAGTAVYEVMSDGTNWWVTTWTKAV